MKTVDPPYFRSDYLRLWVAEDRSKSVRIDRSGDGNLCVTLWRGLAESVLAENLPAEWHPREPDAAMSMSARRRLDYLCVELGQPGVGATYDLMFATENNDPAAFGGFRWRPVDTAADIQGVRLFPELGASFYEAVLGFWDDFIEAQRQADSWVEPLSTYRPATEEERKLHDARTRKALP